MCVRTGVKRVSRHKTTIEVSDGDSRRAARAARRDGAAGRTWGLLSDHGAAHPAAGPPTMS